MLHAHRRKSKANREKGFTLVELAIVIVIIGLIVGGILVGQDLIRAATIRATLGDLEKYNSGATTFRTKYGGLPGDILRNNAVQFGLAVGAARDGTEARGDGDGFLEGCTRNATELGCETGLFWADLSQAGLIPQNISLIASNVGTITTVNSIGNIADMQNYLPSQRLRQGAFQHVYTQNGRNVFALGAHTTNGTGGVLPAAGVSPGEARSMDEKLDDALPHVGVVVALVVSPVAATNLTNIEPGPGAVGTAANDQCVDGQNNNRIYNVTDDAIDNLNCVIQFRASF